MIIEPFFFSLKIPSLHCTLREDIQRTKLIIYGNHAYSFITRNLEFSKITAPIKDTQSLNFKYRFFLKNSSNLCNLE